MVFSLPAMGGACERLDERPLGAVRIEAETVVDVGHLRCATDWLMARSSEPSLGVG